MLPILKTLRRHKTAAGLIVLQIALTFAIVSNALHLIAQRVELVSAPTGLPERELLVLGVSGITRSENAEAQTRADLQALRGLAGVRQATLLNQIPFENSSNYTAVRTTPEIDKNEVGAGAYNASEGWLATLGLRLLAGRDFEAAEYQDAAAVFDDESVPVPAIILNKRLAERLFPGRSALGETVYAFGDRPSKVVGVLEQLPGTHPKSKEENALHGFVVPIRPNFRGSVFVLRVAPEQRDALLKAATELLRTNSAGAKRVVRQSATLEELRDRYYRQDRFMVGLLVAVCVALLVVTAFGIVGLASFWVQQRSRMIGTRRALGATQGQILRYFQAENLLLSSAGIVLGMLAAWGINDILVMQYELPRLPVSYLPIGAALLWGLGQLAVLGPALRAAALPPMLVMRGAA